MGIFFHYTLMGLIYLSHIRFIPAYLFFCFNRELIVPDFNIWCENFKLGHSEIKNFFNLFRKKKEFRALVYYRLGHKSLWIQWLALPVEGLNIITPNIGPGFFIEHGNTSRINAKKIGKDFSIWHNVTIGVGKQFDNDSRPTIGNNVKICTGAIVIGNITIGDNVTIGAGSVVVKSIPSDCVVVGNPARIIGKKQ